MKGSASRFPPCLLQWGGVGSVPLCGIVFRGGSGRALSVLSSFGIDLGSTWGGIGVGVLSMWGRSEVDSG